jgi:hypothetical protein
LPESEEWQLLPKPLSDSEFIAGIKKDRREKGYTASEDSLIKKRVGEFIRFQLPRNDSRFEINISLIDEDQNEAGSANGKMVPSPKGAYFDFKVKKPGKFWVYVFYFRITKDGPYETLPNDRFKLQVTAGPLPVPAAQTSKPARRPG